MKKVIEITLNSYPINEDYPDAWQMVNTEVYYFPRGEAKNIEVLSYAYPSLTKLTSL